MLRLIMILASVFAFSNAFAAVDAATSPKDVVVKEETMIKTTTDEDMMTAEEKAKLEAEKVKAKMEAEKK